MKRTDTRSARSRQPLSAPAGAATAHRPPRLPPEARGRDDGVAAWLDSLGRMRVSLLAGLLTGLVVATSGFEELADAFILGGLAAAVIYIMIGALRTSRGEGRSNRGGAADYGRDAGGDEFGFGGEDGGDK